MMVTIKMMMKVMVVMKMMSLIMETFTSTISKLTYVKKCVELKL